MVPGSVWPVNLYPVAIRVSRSTTDAGIILKRRRRAVKMANGNMVYLEKGFFSLAICRVVVDEIALGPGKGVSKIFALPLAVDRKCIVLDNPCWQQTREKWSGFAIEIRHCSVMRETSESE